MRRAGCRAIDTGKNAGLISFWGPYFRRGVGGGIIHDAGSFHLIKKLMVAVTLSQKISMHKSFSVSGLKEVFLLFQLVVAAVISSVMN